MRKFHCLFGFLSLYLLLGMVTGGAALTPAVPSAPLAGPTERVSISTGGAQATDHSSSSDISADGRFVVFQSNASNLVGGDSNGVTDIFVHDREKKVTERVSVHSNGQQGNYHSFSPAISDDGRFVVFVSWASNLVDGDGNHMADIFAHDRHSNTTELITLADGGANDYSDNPDVSADGRYIVFQSDASNLVPHDGNNSTDIFRWDRTEKDMLRVSVHTNGAETNGKSTRPSISSNGQRIAFLSDSDTLVSGDSGDL